MPKQPPQSPSGPDYDVEKEVVDALTPFLKQAAGKRLTREVKKKLIQAAQVEADIAGQNATVRRGPHAAALEEIAGKEGEAAQGLGDLNEKVKALEEQLRKLVERSKATAKKKSAGTTTKTSRKQQAAGAAQAVPSAAAGGAPQPPSGGGGQNQPQLWNWVPNLNVPLLGGPNTSPILLGHLPPDIQQQLQQIQHQINAILQALSNIAPVSPQGGAPAAAQPAAAGVAQGGQLGAPAAPPSGPAAAVGQAAPPGGPQPAPQAGPQPSQQPQPSPSAPAAQQPGPSASPGTQQASAAQQQAPGGAPQTPSPQPSQAPQASPSASASAQPPAPPAPSGPPVRRLQTRKPLHPEFQGFISDALLAQERAALRERWHEFYDIQTRNGQRVVSGRIPQAEARLRQALYAAYRQNDKLRSIFQLTRVKSINLRQVADIDAGVKAALENYLREVRALDEVRKEIVGLALARRAMRDGLPDPQRFTSREQQTWQRLKQEHDALNAEARTLDQELQSLNGELQTLRGERSQAEQTRDQLTQERDQLVQQRDQLLQERAQAQQSGNQQEVQRLDGEIQKVEQAIQQKEQDIAQKEQEIQQKEQAIQQKEQEVQQKENELRAKLRERSQKREEIRAFIRKVAIRQALDAAGGLGAYAKVMTEAATTFLREGRLDTQVADVGLAHGMERHIRRLLAARAIGSVKEVRDAAVATAQERASAVVPQSTGKVRGFFRRLWAGLRGVTYPHQPGEVGAAGAPPSPRVANLERSGKKAARGLRYGLAALVGAARGGALGVASGAGLAAGAAVGVAGAVAGLAGSFFGGYIGARVGRKIGQWRTGIAAQKGREGLERTAYAQLWEARDRGAFELDESLWRKAVDSAIDTVAARLAEAQSEGLGRTLGSLGSGVGSAWLGAGFARSLLDQPIDLSQWFDRGGEEHVATAPHAGVWTVTEGSIPPGSHIFGDPQMGYKLWVTPDGEPFALELDLDALQQHISPQTQKLLELKAQFEAGAISKDELLQRAREIILEEAAENAAAATSSGQEAQGAETSSTDAPASGAGAEAAAPEPAAPSESSGEAVSGGTTGAAPSESHLSSPQAPESASAISSDAETFARARSLFDLSPQAREHLQRLILTNAAETVTVPKGATLWDILAGEVRKACPQCSDALVNNIVGNTLDRLTSTPEHFVGHANETFLRSVGVTSGDPNLLTAGSEIRPRAILDIGLRRDIGGGPVWIENIPGEPAPANTPGGWEVDRGTLGPPIPEPRPEVPTDVSADAAKGAGAVENTGMTDGTQESVSNNTQPSDGESAGGSPGAETQEGGGPVGMGDEGAAPPEGGIYAGVDPEFKEQFRAHLSGGLREIVQQMGVSGEQPRWDFDIWEMYLRGYHPNVDINPTTVHYLLPMRLDTLASVEVEPRMFETPSGVHYPGGPPETPPGVVEFETHPTGSGQQALTLRRGPALGGIEVKLGFSDEFQRAAQELLPQNVAPYHRPHEVVDGLWRVLYAVSPDLLERPGGFQQALQNFSNYWQSQYGAPATLQDLLTQIHNPDRLAAILNGEWQSSAAGGTAGQAIAEGATGVPAANENHPNIHPAVSGEGGLQRGGIRIGGENVAPFVPPNLQHLQQGLLQIDPAVATELMRHPAALQALTIAPLSDIAQLVEQSQSGGVLRLHGLSPQAEAFVQAVGGEAEARELLLSLADSLQRRGFPADTLPALLTDFNNRFMAANKRPPTLDDFLSQIMHLGGSLPETRAA